MTPKLYDEISNKMTAIWGDYAGWAHSVRAQSIPTFGKLTRAGLIHLGSASFRELRLAIAISISIERAQQSCAVWCANAHSS